MPVSPRRLGTWITGNLFCAVLFFATSAQALEARLVAPKAPDALVETLESASFLLAAARDQNVEAIDIITAARADYRRLLGPLYEAGYYGPDIRIRINGREAASLPSFTRITTVTTAVIEIDPGPRFAFSKAEISPLAPETALPADFNTGAPAGTEAVRAAARAGIGRWRAVGHAKARIAGQSLIADHKNATLAADLRIAPGPEVRFGSLVLDAKTAVSEPRLRKIISLPTGEKFDPDALDTIAARLRRTGVFRSVSIEEAERINPDQSLDIAINVRDAKPRRIGFGAELQSRDGLSLTAFWLHRNLLGGAERLKIEGEISGLQSQSGGTDLLFATEFVRPATLGADTDLRLAFTVEREDDPLYFQEKLGFDIGFTRIHSKRLTSTFGLHLQTNHVRDDFGTRDFHLLGLPIGLTLDHRDDALDPRHGFYAEARIMPYLGTGTAEHALTLSADARYYRPLGEILTAALRLQVGTVLGTSLATTPPDMLFFSGGGGTVRGQPYQSNYITTGGIDSGGLSFLGLSGELRLRAWENISTVLFYDAGFIGETSDFRGGGAWHSGAGIGLRYHTGIGPIRVDLAGPVSGSNSDGLQLYVGIGQAF